jgi:PAS domain S-box-containing protein
MHRRLRRQIDGCLGGEPESSPRLRRLFRKIDLEYRRAEADRMALQRALALLSDLHPRQDEERERRAVSPKTRALSRLFDQAPFATVLCDVDRKVVAWNAAAERLFGIPAGEAIGRDLLMLAFPDTDSDRAEARTELRRVLDGGEAQRLCRPTPARDGTSPQCEWSIVPLRDRKDREAGMAVLVREMGQGASTAEAPDPPPGSEGALADARADGRPVEAELRGALAREELSAEYLPIVGLATGAVSAIEAVIRWEHPRRGHVPNDGFLPLADETGLIVPLGRWLLGEAARDVASAARDGDPLAVHVDLTTNQLLHGDLLDDVDRALGASGIEPRRLVFEVGENTVQHGADAAARIAELRRRGVRVSLDHFGSGACALASLYRFPLDSVKIDSSLFAEEAPRSELVRAIVSLARGAGMAVLAEGIGTPGQLEFVRELGCDAAQGPCFTPARYPSSLPQKRMRG